MVLLSFFEDIKGQKAERKKQTNKQTTGGTISHSIAKYVFVLYFGNANVIFSHEYVLFTKRPLRDNSVVSFPC